GLERRALAGAVALAEDVHAPPDPDLRLRLRHVEQARERTRLQRDRELAHDLNRITRQRLLDEVAYESLDLINDLRKFRAVEEGLDDPPVLLLRGRIDLERQLPYGAHLLLGRNRHLERRVRAERLPVPRRLAHVLVPEQHRDGFSLERVDEDAVGAARVSERIVRLLVKGAGHGWGRFRAA